ncbi:hypothetical protein DV451_003518 [Geotrichum candidum]|uniref:Clathrin light chain n=1 Tax=Geotrichum candidum TaxID=1173061 RepID=A0A9P5G4P7_GEOCN|nr:hypothetical protein DV451_003518 [Geotrichum candidum]KAI9212422.1 hypothetical protein DS838_002699 [Geotrichum bryndzae]KAF5107722.1 hypothetical protein DV453_002875 [Geotrichum candidum]KAF5115284.1 hypothetical protein DV454_002434 [Geotrichum candidum]KAF5119383.1 hypothetical protein DV452_001740 [Geotrichum candidum]
MSSKFPSLEEIDQDLVTPSGADGEFTDFTSNTNNEEEDDFLTREKAALGADAAEFQTSADAQVASADEIAGFKASFPALDDNNNALEIQRRDEQSEAKRKETREKANAAIDDFYENYSSKKDEAIEEVREAERRFLEERDNNITGTTWDRILKLIDTSSKGVKSELSDKTRFKEVLLALKGNPDAPGAAGY